jgi:hypothetical protein
MRKSPFPSAPRGPLRGLTPGLPICLLPALLFGVLALLTGGCKPSHPQLADQLKKIFTTHLAAIDSAATVDTFNVIWRGNITERLGRMIDDTIYRQELSNVRRQLMHALRNKDKDSIKFYQEEVNLLVKEVDSVDKAVPEGDTLHRYGIVVACSFGVQKDSRRRLDSTFIFMDKNMRIINDDFIDSGLHRSLNALGR